MSVEVIPSGSSVVVTQERQDWAKDAERVKDVLATNAATDALQFANVERTAAMHTENIIQDVKDAEARLSNSMASHIENVIQDIKDAESRMTKDAGDKFIQTIQDIKDAAKDTALASGHTNELVQRTEVEVVKQHSTTRDQMLNNFRDAEKVAYQNQMNSMLAFKEQALLSERLASHQAQLSDRLAAKQELLSEKLYAQLSREAAECCCELKQEVAGVKEYIKQNTIDSLREQLLDAKLRASRFRTFSPAVSGSLVASSDDLD